MTSYTCCGVGGPGHRIDVAPTERGKKSALPRPYAKNSFATLKQRSDGRIPSTPFANSSEHIDHIVLQVNAPLRRAGAAGGIQPVGRRVPAGRLGIEDIGPFADERARSLRIRVSHDDVADHAAHIGGDALELRQKLRTDDDDARPRVANDVLIVLRFPQRVQRHRHRADLDRAEEGVEKRRPIEEQQQDSLFRTHPVTGRAARSRRG